MKVDMVSFPSSMKVCCVASSCTQLHVGQSTELSQYGAGQIASIDVDAANRMIYITKKNHRGEPEQWKEGERITRPCDKIGIAMPDGASWPIPVEQAQNKPNTGK